MRCSAAGPVRSKGALRAPCGRISASLSSRRRLPSRPLRRRGRRTSPTIRRFRRARTPASMQASRYQSGSTPACPFRTATPCGRSMARFRRSSYRCDTASRCSSGTVTGFRSTSPPTAASGGTRFRRTSTTAITAPRTTVSPARISSPASSTTITGRSCSQATFR